LKELKRRERIVFGRTDVCRKKERKEEQQKNYNIYKMRKEDEPSERAHHVLEIRQL